MGLTQDISARKLRYNNFPLHHCYDTSGRIGKLIPVQAMPVVAGDLIDEKIEFNIRLAPLSAPAMVRFNVHFHSFYVPYRILTPRSGQETTWEKFILSVGQPLENVPLLPHFMTSYPLSIGDMKNADITSVEPDSYLSLSEVSIGSLWDYLKLRPTPMTAPDNGFWHIPRKYIDAPGIIALNFLAYLKIWNDWYRRDQIEEEVVFPLDLGRIDFKDFTNSSYTKPELPENVSTEFSIEGFVHNLLKLRTRNYERDYFTSALPEPQFGDDVFLGGGELSAMAGANIALSAQGPISGFVMSSALDSSNVVTNVQMIPNIEGAPYDYTMGYNGQVHSFNFGPTLPAGQTGIPFDVTEINGLQATPFSINELRLAMQIQGVREKINRGGTRYVEIMKSIYGVSVSDLRLQRPQYLGGIKAPISIGAVLQTSESDTTPQGTLTGQGGTVGGQRIFRTKRIFEEAGVVMTIMSITPRTGYVGGIERQYLKFDPLDYYTPDFDHLGEQETKRAELYCDFTSQQDSEFEGDDLYLGYNPRFEDYKAAYSTCTGEFRNTLDNWNVYRSFDRPPVLSPEFIHAEPEDFDRLFEFQNIQNISNEHFYAQIYFDIKAKRPMSKYSTPFTFF